MTLACSEEQVGAAPRLSCAPPASWRYCPAHAVGALGKQETARGRNRAKLGLAMLLVGCGAYAPTPHFSPCGLHELGNTFNLNDYECECEAFTEFPPDGGAPEAGYQWACS